MKINPFRPNSPCKPGMFVGRYEQIEKIENCLLLTKANRGVSFLLTGERGIGKTSLLTLIKYFAEGHIEVNKQKLNFLVIETDIDPKTTQSGLIKKIEIGLRRKLAKTEKTRNFFKESWNFIKNLEVAGTKFNANSNTDAEVFFEEFSYSLADTINRITENKDKLFDSTYDGVLIMLDEADHASEELNIGAFIKLILERIQKEGCEKLMFGVAGLPETREKLYQSHPSSLRVFEELELDRLSKTESKEVIDNCKNEYKKLNNSELGMEKEAESLLVYVSEGFPHFIHQYGFCAFETSNEQKITKDDVLKGATGKKGAIAMLGNKYYTDDYYNKIRGDSYREVLNIMSKKLDDWITKDEIRKEYTGTESQLSNAIKALIDRKIILPKAGVRGTYRLQDKGFAWWIMLTCQQEEN
ncbi:AAA family ATPase [Winogradskyella poriferorum]